MNRITILRIGHRFYRDSRVTTHVCLTARALGAHGVVISDRRDKEVEETVRNVTKRFGGTFDIESGIPWRQAIQKWREKGGRVVHLTVYGMPLPKVVPEILETQKDLIIIVGSEKMPGEVFKLADWNVSVTSQPMSEVAALAIFLDWYNQHRELDKDFPGAEVQIVPSRDRKIVRPVAAKS